MFIFYFYTHIQTQRIFFLNFVNPNQIWIAITPLFRLVGRSFVRLVRKYDVFFLFVHRHLNNLNIIRWITHKLIKLLQTEKSFRNLIKSNRYQIVFTIFNYWFGTANGGVRLIPNQSLKMIWYNLISVWRNKIWKIFLHVYPLCEISYEFCWI